MPTLRNPLSVPSSYVVLCAHTTYEDGKDSAFRNVAHKIQTPGRNHPQERIQENYISYNNQQMHNNFTNYHTATCFDTVVSSSDSL